MVPNQDDVEKWLQQADQRGARTVRTGAIFPTAASAFLDAGFHVVDTLTLLARRFTDRPLTASTAGTAGTDDVPARVAPRVRVGDPVRLRRLRPSMLIEAATIDRRAFSAPWANDTTALGDIMTATPQHRSRSVHINGRMVAFSISGRADHAGYVQRLAVDPSARRQGVASVLLDDALHWMRRRGVEQALVNTASNNRPALALYESVGFQQQPGSLLILEQRLR
jgi:ribosomal-protein-alanine N-acetyltransferase